MDKVIMVFQEFVDAYLDDLIITIASASLELEEHLSHVRTVLNRLRAAGLTGDQRECRFGVQQAHYLGHTARRGGVAPYAVCFPKNETKGLLFHRPVRLLQESVGLQTKETSSIPP